MAREDGRTTLVGYLSHPDAAGAIAWLEAVGFVTVVRQDGPDGRVLHAELRDGDAVVMLASDDAPYEVPAVHGVSTGAGLYLVTDDVDERHERAVAAGGRTLIGPEDTGWGARRARVLDPGGREWTFGTYRPGG